MTTGTFRFGVQASSRATSATEWAEQARKIEALGYSTLFMPDHFVDTPLAPMVALPFAAAATTTLRVGMLVLGNDYKHPAVVAKEAATLDVLSDGRLEFGLGAGWMTADYEALGLPYDRAGRAHRAPRRGDRGREGRVGRRPVRLRGRALRDHRDYDALPKPVQQPRPPILVGGGGRRCCGSPGARPTSSASTRTSARARSAPKRHATRSASRPRARSGGCARARASGSTTSSCRSATSWLRSPTTPSGLAEAMAPAFGR